MPKSKQQKQESVAALVEELKKAKGVVFANFQGLTVAESEELRKVCRQEKVEVIAAKKTLVRRALDEVGMSAVDVGAFQGGVAAFLGLGDEISPAKVVSKFAKVHQIVAIFGGILEGKFIGAQAVTSLALLPGRLELLSKMVGSLNAPISGFVQVNASILRGLMNVLNAFKEKKVA